MQFSILYVFGICFYATAAKFLDVFHVYVWIDVHNYMSAYSVLVIYIFPKIKRNFMISMSIELCKCIALHWLCSLRHMIIVAFLRMSD